MSSKLFAIVAGAGTGTGRAMALRFAKAYPVVLASRTSDQYQDTVSDINKAGGRAVGVSVDIADSESMKSALNDIKKELPDFKLAAAVYNVSSGFAKIPFLDITHNKLKSSLTGNAMGLFNFAKETIPLLLEAVPYYGAAAAGMFARRALAQSLAREFNPKGVHVAHAIIDGVVDIPQTKDVVANHGVEDGKLKPEAIAESYWHLHTQPRSAFTQEMDLRPFAGRF
ncbi:NAD(P)-binding protein [Xylaria longipes]|nr:NAD(P)-binding protein [Xylaria longipes]